MSYLESLTKVEIQQLLRDKNLPISGNKDVLIDRLNSCGRGRGRRPSIGQGNNFHDHQDRRRYDYQNDTAKKPYNRNGTGNHNQVAGIPRRPISNGGYVVQSGCDMFMNIKKWSKPIDRPTASVTSVTERTDHYRTHTETRTQKRYKIDDDRPTASVTSVTEITDHYRTHTETRTQKRYKIGDEIRTKSEDYSSNTMFFSYYDK